MGCQRKLIDDALDYGGTSAKLGKKVGDDFREGKITLPIVLAFRRGSDEERTFWREALENGFSLIIFPEGTRSAQPFPNPFKSGLYHLAMEFPNVELIPVYIENLHRSMPKGALIPVPAICTVRFGAPLERVAGEDKAVFLERARAAVIALEAD